MRGFAGFFVGAAIVLGALLGIDAFMGAESAVHEIEGLICALIVTVGIAAAYVVAAIDDAARRISPDKPVEKKEAA